MLKIQEKSCLLIFRQNRVKRKLFCGDEALRFNIGTLFGTKLGENKNSNQLIIALSSQSLLALDFHVFSHPPVSILLLYRVSTSSLVLFYYSVVPNIPSPILIIIIWKSSAAPSESKNELKI